MPNSPAIEVTASILRPLKRAKPDQLEAYVWDAVDQAYGAYRFAHEFGDSKSAATLLKLHTELTEVYGIDVHSRPPGSTRASAAPA